jgi:CheY-like chemotaxis protein
MGEGMGKVKILIVEDDISTQMLYDKGLSDEVFEKRFDENGVNALETYKTWNPDLIILDIFLPVMTGYSVLNEIRKELKDYVTPIIMATSASSPDDVKGCIKLGIQGYIIKPFNHKEIAEKIMDYYKIHLASMKQETT